VAHTFNTPRRAGWRIRAALGAGATKASAGALAAAASKSTASVTALPIFCVVSNELLS